MASFIDLTGQRFGSLVVLHKSGSHLNPCGETRFRWVCACDCGRNTEVQPSNLKAGKQRSCGCLANKLRSSTVMKKYGVTNISNKPEVRERISTHHKLLFNTEEMKDRTRKTCIGRYGGPSPMCSEKVQERSRASCLARYGVEYAMQDKSVQDKVARTNNKRIILKNWLDGSEVVCIGSYEVAVVNFLNGSQVQYKWQPEVFQLKSYTYRPDLYLVADDQWIEIKGRFYKDAEAKWFEFSSLYPNSQLWDYKMLKTLNIL